MQKKRWSFILSAALLALLVAFGVIYHLILVEQREQGIGDDPSESTEGDGNPNTLEHPVQFSDVSFQSLESFEMNGHHYQKGENDEFYETDNPDMPLDQALIKSVIDKFAYMKSYYRDSESDGGVLYGYDKTDAPTITLVDYNDNKVDIWIGKQCQTDSRRYASTSLQSGVFLVNIEDYCLNMKLYDFLKLDSIPFIEKESLLSVTVQEGGRILYTAECDTDATRNTWNSLTFPDFFPDAVQAYQPTEEQLTEWGLSKGRSLTIRYRDAQTGEEKDFTYQIGALTEQDGVSKMYVSVEQIVYLTYISADIANILESLPKGN